MMMMLIVVVVVVVLMMMMERLANGHDTDSEILVDCKSKGHLLAKVQKCQLLIGKIIHWQKCNNTMSIIPNKPSANRSI